MLCRGMPWLPSMGGQTAHKRRLPTGFAQHMLQFTVSLVRHFHVCLKRELARMWDAGWLLLPLYVMCSS